MIFDRNEPKEVIALLGAGSMGTAIIRRFAAGRKILLGDISEKNLERVSRELTYSGYDVETFAVNAAEQDSVEAFAKKAASLGPVKYYVHTAGASPSQASPEHILRLDMTGTGYAVDAFGKVMAEGGAGLIISSIAAAHSKTAAQIILRWHLQSGNIAIPGSSDENHILENFSIFDFELTEEEMNRLRALEKDERFSTY